VVAVDAPSQALVIGVSKYRYVASLPATRDAQGMRDVLASPDYCAYPPERVKLLEDDAATRDNILAALDAVCDAASAAGSRTFLYFSGHGGQGLDGSSYILPVDARKGDYPTTALSARDLSRRLDRCSGDVTVVLDSCYAAGMAGGETAAGGAAGAAGSTDLASFGDGLRYEIQSKGRVVFAASRADGFSYGSLDAPYGIFTGYLLDGLRGQASTDGLGVTVQQLFAYVSKCVRSSSGGMQQPVFIAHVEEFYSLTRYPRRLPLAVVFDKDVFISYDRADPALRTWVARDFQPCLERAGRSIWAYDQLGYDQLAVQDAITRSKYVVVLLTGSYLRNRLEEFNATMAILQAINTRTPRFIPILREDCDVPLAIAAFVGLDLRDQNQMGFGDEMDRLIARLKKEPHER